MAELERVHAPHGEAPPPFLVGLGTCPQERVFTLAVFLVAGSLIGFILYVALRFYLV